MKLLLLLPNFVLLAISGYNLSDSFSGGTAINLPYILLHLIVAALCVTFIAMIVKSMFVIRYVETPQHYTAATQDYEELTLHSA